MATAQVRATVRTVRETPPPLSDGDEDIYPPFSPPKSPSPFEDEEGVDLLHVTGVAFEYTIPRFPVVRIMLRQMKLQAILPDSKVETYDGFIQDHPSLDRYRQHFPVSIHVLESCFIEVST